MERSVNFVPVATAGGVSIFTLVNSFISFTNSPYYSHEHGLAVDIYPPSDEAGALSPVRGDVLEVFMVRSPRPKYFQPVEKEKLLIIRPVENPSLVVRILHTDCNSIPGTVLSLETPLGGIVRSGFFDFWTQRHIHVEVRNTGHLLRAKGNLPMVPLTRGLRLGGTPSEKPPRLQIVSANRNYTLVSALDNGAMTLGPFNGVGCRVGETAGILDAGIPHYKLGSVHLESRAAVSLGDTVSLWGTKIGEVVKFGDGFAFFESIPVEVYLNEQIIRGLSIYLWIGRRPLIKLIPLRPSQPRWCKEVNVDIHTSAS